jgi:hypothetical protein
MVVLRTGALLSRLATGRWNDKNLQPSILNAQAAALPGSANIFSSSGQIVATPPAFVNYQPAPYLRPYDLPTGRSGGGGRGGR